MFRNAGSNQPAQFTVHVEGLRALREVLAVDDAIQSTSDHAPIESNETMNTALDQASILLPNPKKTTKINNKSE